MKQVKQDLFVSYYKTKTYEKRVKQDETE